MLTMLSPKTLRARYHHCWTRLSSALSDSRSRLGLAHVYIPTAIKHGAGIRDGLLSELTSTRVSYKQKSFHTLTAISLACGVVDEAVLPSPPATKACLAVNLNLHRGRDLAHRNKL